MITEKDKIIARKDKIITEKLEEISIQKCKIEVFNNYKFYLLKLFLNIS